MSTTWSRMYSRFSHLLLVLAVGLACSGDSTDTTEPDPDPTPDPDPDVVEIELTDNRTFSPSSVTIEPGTTVRWVNVSEEFHTITPRDNEQEGVWTAQNSNPDDTYEFTFETAGQVYDYFCEPHEAEGMEGTITVE